MTGRTPGDGDEAMDLGTIARDDALLDALGRGDAAPEGDALAGLLAAWRSELADEPPTVVRPGAPAPAGDAPSRPAVRRPRPWTLRLAAAAVALLALVSGVGIGSRDAGPGSPLWSLTRLLHPQQAEVRGIEDTIAKARAALDAGRLDDAEALVAQGRRNLARVEDPAAVTRLSAALDVLARDLAAARAATAPPTTAPAGTTTPATPAPTAVPSPTTSGTPRPGPATSGGAPRPGSSGSPAPADSPLLPLPKLPLPLPSVSISGLPLPELPLPTGGGLLD
ncbi:anti-sigma-D factor RsdA [Micromonospora chaiyaphumensis]|uniref:Anti-sigma-D factor RsdA to sigma factor binding region n=1 Tax=Micromonospora chaiyaphumensis TaxID=307119 RepID=A0A1C4U531_9ACTN|nr:anti-sigma-D factor RsdA [Micromonospora chaiyaphumensis]SCE66800.1 Anti-sigma-D factor RsdA to sigma factor binding region [Micromonospora chaiyaphumensis]